MIGTETFRKVIEGMSNNDLWLLEHMLTVLHSWTLDGWTLDPKKDIKTVRFKEGPSGHYITPQYMREQFDRNMGWLQSYQKSWGTQKHKDTYDREHNLRSILSPVHPSYLHSLKLLELLQVVEPGPDLHQLLTSFLAHLHEINPTVEVSDEIVEAFLRNVPK